MQPAGRQFRACASRSLGRREPTLAEVEAARGARLREELRVSLKRNPTPKEMLEARMRIKLGREPTEVEMDAAREAEEPVCAPLEPGDYDRETEMRIAESLAIHAATSPTRISIATARWARMLATRSPSSRPGHRGPPS